MSLAARSRPIAISPKARWPRSKACWDGAAPPGPAAPPCLAAIFRSTASTHWCLRCRSLAPNIAPATIRRLARAYGTEARRILARRRSGTAVRRRSGRARSGLPARKGMGAHADDILWRRSKLGLRFTAGEERPAADIWKAAGSSRQGLRGDHGRIRSGGGSRHDVVARDHFRRRLSRPGRGAAGISAAFSPLRLGRT